MVPWLRDFTDLPLGVYPNLGHLAARSGASTTRSIRRATRSSRSSWRDEGAQLIGGCCGVTPEHIAAVARAVAGTRPGRRRRPLDDHLATARAAAPVEPWRDERGRRLHPLPFPRLAVDPGVFVPTTGSYLVWKTLFDRTLGEGLSCLDVGCGCGILSVQLALNGAARVHAIDIDEAAVAEHARERLQERRRGAHDRRDDRPLRLGAGPERFDLIVASLYQMPVDPYEESSRPPSARLLGPQPARPLHRASCRG